jgi:hypothetical protein
MRLSTVIELPAFDTGQYDGSDFRMLDGGATLTVKLLETANFSIQFKKVRWHQFTALPNCTPEMIHDAYFRLVEYPDSPAVAKFIREDQMGAIAYAHLSHYRIFLDEIGCHELYAQSATAL